MAPTTRADSVKKPSDMRIFEGRYFNINRRLLMCLGLWPYEAKTRKYVLRLIFIFLLSLGCLFQLVGMFLYYKDIDQLMVGILCLSVTSIMILKMLAMILGEGNMRLLLRSIADNWRRIQNDCERDILHKYSERARKASIFYVAVIVSAGFIASTISLIPKILDFIRLLGNPRPNIYVSPGEIFIDRETHFYLYCFLAFVIIMQVTLVTITIEAMYIVTVDHCCALYAIVRSRLLKLRPILQNNSLGTEDVDPYEWLCQTIKIHQDALAFSSLLNDSYSILFLFLWLSTLFIIPFDSCAIIANLDTPLHLLPYVFILGATVVHDFFISYPGQRVIDHQLSLVDAAYCNEWHAVPPRTRKLLFIFMLRCSRPVMITAGDLVPINLEIYFKVMKTAASYITVASSFRE